jgi:uncharacterized protein YbaR (Trm112 family)
MKPILLDYLVCPDCQLELRCRAERCDGDDIVAGTLDCSACGRSYPILRGIPRFVDVERLDRSTVETVDGFGA